MTSCLDWRTRVQGSKHGWAVVVGLGVMACAGGETEESGTYCCGSLADWGATRMDGWMYGWREGREDSMGSKRAGTVHRRRGNRPWTG